VPATPSTPPARSAAPPRSADADAGAPSEAPLRRVESRLRSSGGLSLFRRAWLAQQPRRAVALVHGFAEHSGRYEHVGEALARRGCAVHALDLRGPGRSPGARGHVDRFSRLLDDAEALVATAREQHPGLPLFVLGHSMGGLVVASLLRDRRPDVTGAVLSGPALEVAASGGRRTLARALQTLAPRLRLPAGVAPRGLSRDPDVVQRYLADPLVFRRISAGLASELLQASRRARGGGEAVEVPLLGLHGGSDPICAPAGSERFFAGVRSSGSVLHIYPGLRHEVLNEPEWRQVLEDLLDWMLERERS